MDLAIDPTTDDLGLSNGDFVITDGDVAVAQNLRQRLRLFLGEWFLAQNAGVPYHDEVFVKNPRWAVLDALFKAEILGTEGVVELLSFLMSLNTVTRTLNLIFEVRTENGVVISFDEDLGGSTSEDSGVKQKTVTVSFNDEQSKDISVAAYGFDAQRCEVTVLDTDDSFSDAEVRITRPSASIIRLSTQVNITKTFRVLIEEIGV